MNPEEFLGEGNFASRIATHLGFAYVPAIRVETATSSGAAAIFAGFTAVASGTARAVLVVGGERMTHLPTPRVSEIIGRSIDPYERSYGRDHAGPGGPDHPGPHGPERAQRARDLPGGREEPRQRRAHPYAHFRAPVALAAVMASRLVADPLRLFHCCPISDGAAALVLTASARPCGSPESGRAPMRSPSATVRS